MLSSVWNNRAAWFDGYQSVQKCMILNNLGFHLRDYGGKTKEKDKIYWKMGWKWLDGSRELRYKG